MKRATITSPSSRLSILIIGLVGYGAVVTTTSQWQLQQQQQLLLGCDAFSIPSIPSYPHAVLTRKRTTRPFGFSFSFALKVAAESTTALGVLAEPTATNTTTAENEVESVMSMDDSARKNASRTEESSSSSSVKASSSPTTTIPSQTTSLRRPSSSKGTFSRAQRLLEIVTSEMVGPIALGLTKSGLPVDEAGWQAFWDSSPDNDGPLVSSVSSASSDDGDDSSSRRSSTKSRSLASRVVTALEQMGPTYVKFGQALASRPDIVPRSLALSLSTLQDQMTAFDTNLAKEMIRDELANAFESSSSSSSPAALESFLESLSDEPVAAASIGQVYSAQLPLDLLLPPQLDNDDSVGSQPPRTKKVAVKVQRPGIRALVEQDAALLLQITSMLESLPAVWQSSSSSASASAATTASKQRLIQTDLTGAVTEFMSRMYEELDYSNEADNLELFASLYSHRRRDGDGDVLLREEADPNKKNKKPHRRRHRQRRQSSNTPDKSDIQVVVPQVYRQFCTDNVLTMEWIDGTKLVDLESEEASRESMILIEQCIDCTLSQLLDTGILHADPHGGNLLKVLEPRSTGDTSSPRQQLLGYIDFGLLARVPLPVRDGLVCAVAELVFARNVTAVANLFGELALIPSDVLEDPSEMAALADELETALTQVLVYDSAATKSDQSSSSSLNAGTSTTQLQTSIPTLRFDKLLDVLARLVPRFRFQLPPYFLNNARALSTLEGMAREIEPTFNVLQFIYPYALKRLLSNPTDSPVVDQTLEDLICNEEGRIDPRQIDQLLRDATALTGYSRRRVLRDIMASKNGPKWTRRFVREQLRGMMGVRRAGKDGRTKPKTKTETTTTASSSRRRQMTKRLGNYLRL